MSQYFRQLEATRYHSILCCIHTLRYLSISHDSRLVTAGHRSHAIV